MYKTILVPGLDATCRPAALELALRVARMGGGRVEYLHVHPDAEAQARGVAAMDVESAMFADQIRAALLDADKACVAAGRKTFDSFCTREKLTPESAASAQFRETEGDAVAAIVAEACYADLVVLGRPEAPGDLVDSDAGDILVGSGRPVLLTASARCDNPIETVAIAWKESAASVHAVTAAMPLLRAARQIHIVGVAEGEDAPDVERLAAALGRHGLTAKTHLLRCDGAGACDALLETAVRKLEAGVLVMGAYGHSRAREFVLGGFTRRVLHAAPLPVLLAH
jgi:nucleotide-binding universal stress UspA family protein